MSAVGSTATTLGLVRGWSDAVLHAAFDAGIVDLEIDGDGSVRARWAADGTATTSGEVEDRHGDALRHDLGIRRIAELAGADVETDIAAPLPHDLGTGGLRRLAGLSWRQIRDSELKDMHGLFDDDLSLGPSLQSQLFAYAGLGALAALPRPLSELIPHPADFRVAAASCFPGLDSSAELRSPTDTAAREAGPTDRFAARLASSLASHGGALVSAMLAPSYPLGRTTKNPGLLGALRHADGYMQVPQAPMNTAAACASSLVGLCDLAGEMLLDHPGHRAPRLALWTAADAATRPDWQVVEAFGPNALVTSAKLEALNEGRSPTDRRAVADSLAPFDVDAAGTVIGDGGSGVVVTTLDVALRNFLDVTSIIVGWGQSAETGGKAHFAGVGFGGENALIQAFEIAAAGHGLGVDHFGYVVAHATGTRANSKTDLTTIASARRAAAERAGRSGALPTVPVGAPKALGDGHTMGETGLKAVSQAIQYLLGEPAVGLPTLRRVDPEVGPVVEEFELSAAPVRGDAAGGAICATQGFGGYNGAVALSAATPDALARYRPDPAVLAAYLERWPEIRRERELAERRARARRGATLELAQHHRWPSAE